MPIIKSAKKALRRDRRRTKINLQIERQAKMIIKEFRKKPSKKNLGSTFSQIDRAAKKKIFHKGKAARLKSRLSRLLKASRK